MVDGEGGEQGNLSPLESSETIKNSNSMILGK